MDTLFFRDARSFTAGAGTTAEYNFPSPLTFFGAIGNALLDSLGIELKEFINGDNNSSVLGRYDESLQDTKIKLKGPYLHIGNEIVFPPPANIWVLDKCVPFLANPYFTDWKWDIKKENLTILKPGKKYSDMKLLHQYISIEDLSHYLLGSLKSLHLTDEEEIFMEETRYGNAISKKSMAVIEHCLYTTTHLKFKEYPKTNKFIKTGFTLFANGIEKSDILIEAITIGGERRKAVIKIFENDKIIHDQPKILEKIQFTKKFFIYFTTPSIFKNGWYIDLPGEFNDARLVGAAVNKPTYISGWKINSKNFRGNPRPIKKATPAGSVYFFKADSWDDSKFKNFFTKYHFAESLSDEYPSAGFGIGLIGSW